MAIHSSILAWKIPDIGYVLNNFRNELKLEDVANEVALAPTYFSLSQEPEMKIKTAIKY